METAVGGDVWNPTRAQAAKKALAIYAEEHVQGGVVAVLGDASAGIGELALRLGARAVHVWDPDVDRALAAAGSPVLGLSVWPLVRAREDLTRRDFDVAIVAELGAFRDPAAVLAEVRRMVGQDGLAIVMARNPESVGAAGASGATSFDYYELFDAVAAEFDFVRMVAQLPFRGVALVELGDGDEGEGEGRDPGAGVSVDTQLVDDGGPPDAFVAVASQRDIRMDPYAIVQLPFDAEAEASVGADATADPTAGAGATAGLSASAVADAVAAAMAEAEARAAVATAAALASAVASAQSRAANDAASAITAAEAAAARAVTTAETEITRLESTLAERTAQVAAFAHELDEARGATEAARLTAAEELDELIARVDRAERKSAELAAALASTQSDASHADTSAAEHELLERTLRERAQVIRELEAEVARRERLVRDLAGALEEANVASFEGGPGNDNPALAARLDAMALELARRESDAQAAAWENEELQRRLAIAERAASGSASFPGAPGSPASPAAPVTPVTPAIPGAPNAPASPALATPPADDQGGSPRLAAALDELDALRLALVQEHDARVRAESHGGRDAAASSASSERSPAATEQR